MLCDLNLHARGLLTAGVLAILATSVAACGGPTYPNCDNDSHCHTGEFCVNGHCQQCRTDSDCQAGSHCAEGACAPIQGYCQGRGQCGQNEDCQNNRCVQVATSTVEPEPPTPTAGPCSLDTLFFDYESSDLTPAARNALETAARCIRDRNIPHVTVVGHTDPRGTEEYNLALGDRRARAVMQYLTALGVPAATFDASSRGEEDAAGEDEGGWSRDRRAVMLER